MAPVLLRIWRPLSVLRAGARSFWSDAALEALSKASEDKVPNLVLDNYPSFSGASRLSSPTSSTLASISLASFCLSLPLSLSVTGVNFQ